VTPRPATQRPELLDEREAAAYIGFSAAYLRADRYRGHVGAHTPGPAYLRLGRTIRYRREDLDAWLAKHRVARAATKPGAPQPEPAAA
jgi:predicted DNA-binding transcriptional regulator AlpA